MIDDFSDFLDGTDWAEADIQWFRADWSVRNYARLQTSKGQKAVLLSSPHASASEVTVPNGIDRWVEINEHFHRIGVRVPDILLRDIDKGLVLMEDFGDQTIAAMGLDVYLKATDILITMRDHPDSLSIPLKCYRDTHIYDKYKLVPEHVLNIPHLEKEWSQAWITVEDSLPPCPIALCHMDFGSMNLIWNNNEIGVIDYQDAFQGPFVYDIVNLLEDIRLIVPEDIKMACKTHYCDGLNDDEKQAFEAWYHVIHAQFYSKVLWQIAYHSKVSGRTDMLQYQDRVFTTFQNLLHLPELGPIFQLLKDHHDKR